LSTFTTKCTPQKWQMTNYIQSVYHRPRWKSEIKKMERGTKHRRSDNKANGRWLCMGEVKKLNTGLMDYKNNGN